MRNRFVPKDQEIRDQIRTNLDKTLFVEAGAGTGKTSSLVDRVIELVSTGRTSLPHIAAITFNEVAASELRDRIREALEKTASNPLANRTVQERCEKGIADLDQASIKTLHGFASEILQKHPLEAGLPPGFKVLDAISSDVEFEECWNQWVSDALDDPDLENDLRFAFSLGLTLDAMHDTAKVFDKNHDLLVDTMFKDVPSNKIIAASMLVENSQELGRLITFSKLKDSDPLFTHVESLLSNINQLHTQTDGTHTSYQHLIRILPIKMKRGKKTDWNQDPGTGENACTTVKIILDRLHNIVSDEIDSARKRALPPLLRAVQQFVLESVEQRQKAGLAKFHDLLVWARNLLKNKVEVCDHFRTRFTHILVDEVQDTDPLQMEITLLLAERIQENDTKDKRSTTWTDIVPEPGKLFAVGDPKQYIYKFRRADVTQLNLFKKSLNVEPVELIQNFRSHKNIIDWINHLFSQWMVADQNQAQYTSLKHRWDAQIPHERSPKVWQLGKKHDGTKLGQLRIIESEEIAKLVVAIGQENWQVLDLEATESASEQKYRSANLSDICILMPARTGLRNLEIALEDYNIPFRLEGASLVFNTQEVRDLLNCLRAVDDPSNQVALVATLRSSAFSCSDVDLVLFSDKGGRFDYLDPGISLDDRVSDAFKKLKKYHLDRVSKPLPLLIEEFIRGQMLMEGAFASDRPRERWRRYRLLVEMARKFSQSRNTSLRTFLDWVERQMKEGASFTEIPVPETDEDSIRIMTIHGSKGLEFPIVIMTGLNGNKTTRNGNSHILFNRTSNSIEVAVNRHFTTDGYQQASHHDHILNEQEFIRLIYVGTTRARDHLVLNVNRESGDHSSAASTIYDFMRTKASLWEPVQDFPHTMNLPQVPQYKNIKSESTASYQERVMWIAERRDVLAAGNKRVSVGATELINIYKPKSIATSPNISRTTEGARLGRAVHAALQVLDFRTLEGIDGIAKTKADSEGIPDKTKQVVSLIKAATNNVVVKRAIASGRMWREVPVSLPLGIGIVDCVIDLLFEEHDGLVIVDYKTDAEYSPQTMSKYHLQSGIYALALQELTHLPVKEITLLFLSQNNAYQLDNIPSVIEEAKLACKAYFVGDDSINNWHPQKH